MRTNSGSISNFLTTPYFDNLVKETRGRYHPDSLAIALIDSVMACGYQANLLISKRTIGPEERSKAQQYSNIALKSRRNVLLSANTLLKLQVGSLRPDFKGTDTDFSDAARYG